MSLSFSLKPITESDIPALAELAGLAFETDRHTLLKAAHPTSPYDHAAGVPESIRHWLSLPRRVLATKAVDDESGAVLGFVGWASRGFDLSPAAPGPADGGSGPGSSGQGGGGAGAGARKPPRHSVPTDYVEDTSPGLDPLARLNELTSSHFAEFQRRMMPEGARCMYILGINVSPRYQGRGIGRALIRQGTDLADAEGVPCWVHSSEAGAATFRKRGWEVDEVLEIDLDEWASQMDLKPPGGDEKWGTYTFRYFVRQPQAV